MTDHLKLPAQFLQLEIDLAGFEKIPKLAEEKSILGQSRARSALEFGVAMQHSGYNIYVMGDSGTGRLAMIMNHLDQLSTDQETPPDYVYVNNFENSREPVSLEIPAGQGHIFVRDIDKLIDDLLTTFPAAFESPGYQQKKTTIERNFNQRYNHAVDLVEKQAQEKNIALFRGNDSISFAPIRENKSLDEEQFTQLPQKEREVFQSDVEKLEEYLADVLLELPQWRRELIEKTRLLNNETISSDIDPLFAQLNKKYINIDDVISYLSALKENLTGAIIDFLGPEQSSDGRDNKTKRVLLTEQYVPLLLVGHTQNKGAPVLYESHPTHQNLFGKIEYINDQGTLVTSYRRICPGSLHRANGGYLILDAEKILNYPFVWDGLKRALKSGRVEIESAHSEMGINTISLKPEVILLDVKVILLGSREIYYLLQELDSEFNEMFRVLADFDDHIQRTQESMQQFASLMNRQTDHLHAKPLSLLAIKRLIEHSCRLAENQQHLSAKVNDSLEIIAEANLLCAQSDCKNIDKQHIERALDAREQRTGRIARQILDDMLEGTILIDSEGSAIGKVNGLTVLEVGESSFGAPTRITTTVYPGSRGIVDIEREVELGQSIHSKGVLILTGYLGHHYAQNFPLAISASIAIEQSYGYIDGDSASLAEVCALISALTGIPVKQGIALTGSINQYGEVQAVGGVNEKIEGFFNLCKARQFTGEQAVIIPKANQGNLVLKQEVIAAVEQGLFTIYTVTHVNETLELLTGLPAGNKDSEGQYPPDSINYKVIARLKEISEISPEKEDAHEDE